MIVQLVQAVEKCQYLAGHEASSHKNMLIIHLNTFGKIYPIYQKIPLERDWQIEQNCK